MPAIVKVRIVEGRNLPVMDRASELTDAYVDVKFQENTFRTLVCSKTLCPRWNSEWFKFETDDDQLQEDLLQIKVFDKDTVTANDPIGKVQMSLLPLVCPGNPSCLSGWFPIFDTLHGIRGQIKIIVKVKYISVTNRNSVGVKFFYSTSVPSPYRLVEVKGFVEELVVDDDPEYKWIDKIRTNRASNDARQLLFSRLAATLKGKIINKVLNAGGNAVIGYRQSFDLEGQFGVVVRAIGTSVLLRESTENPFGAVPVTTTPTDPVEPATPVPISTALEEVLVAETPPDPDPLLMAANRVQKRSGGSSHKLSITSDSGLSETAMFFPEARSPETTLPIAQTKVSFSSGDFPFYTMSYFPTGFVRSIGGLVTSRSVRLLDKLESMPEESDSRDKLWLEIRKEIKTHMRSLACNAVIGYSETSTICEKLCVLSATGTAVILGSSYSSVDQELPWQTCSPCHIPYNVHTSPFNMTPQQCAVCENGCVPDMLLTTIDVLPGVAVNGNGCFIKAQAFRWKRRQTWEASANSIGQLLPFMEYELHQQLSQTLKIRGMNAVVGIRYELCVGEAAVCSIISGTAVYLEPLPSPSPIRVRYPAPNQSGGAGKGLPGGLEDKWQVAIQQAHDRSVVCNKITTPDTGTSPNDLCLSLSNKDAVIVDIEDVRDEKRIERSLVSPFPEHIYTSSGTHVPGLIGDIGETSHLLTQVCRLEVSASLDSDTLARIIDKNLQLLAFKLRNYSRCTLTNIRFRVHMPEEDEMVIAITGVAHLSPLAPAVLSSMQKRRRFRRFFSSGSNEIRFCEQVEDGPGGLAGPEQPSEPVVQLTAGGYVAGTVRACLGHLNVYLIRESTDVRDLSSFTKTFMVEAQAVLRAHVASLGGTALLHYRVQALTLIDGPHKNQAQILLNISGDAVILAPSDPATPLLKTPTAPSSW